MKIYISGNHTAPYGDFPYEKGDEFERELRKLWSAVEGFLFNCIDGADVMLDQNAIADMTVREVYTKLEDCINEAQQNVDWNIWSIHVPKPNK